jgi:glutaredoxin
MALKNQLKHVAGKDVGEIMLYALSTCQWCNKTKALLKSLKIEYYYIDANLLDKNDEEELHGLFKQMKLDMNFPVIIVNDKKVIVGYQEDKIRKLSK